MALTDEALFRSCGVRVAFTGRGGGVSEGCYAHLNCAPYVGDDAMAVQRNQDILREAAGARDAVHITARQVHGTEIVPVLADTDIAAAIDLAARGADGFLVGRDDVAALLLGADCPLVVIVSPTGHFALAHAGWRGAVAGVSGKAAAQLARLDGCDPAGFNAYIGPHICADCFEVQKDVSALFEAEFGSSCVPDERHVSLRKAIECDLERAGMDPERVIDAQACTKCHPDKYFSYRATGGECGRHAAIAVRPAK